MNTKHTPGPWMIKPGKYNRYAWHICTKAIPPDGDSTVIAETADRRAIHPNPESEANAHLMASSPELLQALKVTLAELRAMHETHCSNCTGGCPFCEIRNIAVAAIDEAEGVTP